MIPVGQRALSLEDFSDILFEKKPVELNEAELEKIERSFHESTYP